MIHQKFIFFFIICCSIGCVSLKKKCVEETVEQTLCFDDWFGHVLITNCTQLLMDGVAHVEYKALVYARFKGRMFGINTTITLDSIIQLNSTGERLFKDNTYYLSGKYITSSSNKTIISLRRCAFRKEECKIEKDDYSVLINYEEPNRNLKENCSTYNPNYDPPSSLFKVINWIQASQ